MMYLEDGTDDLQIEEPNENVVIYILFVYIYIQNIKGRMR